MKNSIPPRRGEKILAFAICATVVTCFLWKNPAISSAASTGLLFGIMAPFFISMTGTSAQMEGWLLLLATILVGIKYGVTALCTNLLGFVIYAIVLFAVLALSNEFKSNRES